MSRTFGDYYVPFFYGCGVRYSLIPRKARRLSFCIEGYGDSWDRRYMPTTQKDLEQPYCFKTWSSAQYAAREWEKRFRKHGFKGDDAIICVTVCWKNSEGEHCYAYQQPSGEFYVENIW